MKQFTFRTSIATVFLLSLAYWIYLAFFTRMEIIFDSVNYESLGKMLISQGWTSYFTTGPNREPIYPLLVAISMQMEHLTGLDYVKIMAFLGALIMLVTQALTYKILYLLKIRNSICIVILSYMALSPALNNSAFSLYSEISALPVILGIILTSVWAWESIEQNKKIKSFVLGGLLGILLTTATFIKAIFECITPIYLFIFFVMAFSNRQHTNTQKFPALLLCLVTSISFFYVPITGYKWLNLNYNGNYAITNRGSWALYGATARRMEPLTLKRFAEALAYIPGEGVCNGLFGAKECDFWSFRESDKFGFAKQSELIRQHLPPEKANTTLLKESAQKAMHNPFQYGLLTFLEGLKMFFWESTKIGFVNYPHWLQKIYDTKLFNNGLRFIISFATIVAVAYLWLLALKPQESPVIFLMGTLIFFYILFFSSFFILTRYAFPIVPLYLIAIALLTDKTISKIHPKKREL